MAARGKRNPRITVVFTPEELGLINGRCGNQASAYLKALALGDIGEDDQECRQLYALSMTLNEVLGVLIEEAEDQSPDLFIRQLRALREAVKTLQQAAAEQHTAIAMEESLKTLHDAVGGNRLAQLESPAIGLERLLGLFEGDVF